MEIDLSQQYMEAIKNPNKLLAERIFEELVKSNLISKDNREFLEALEKGGLSENDWRANLLDRIHRKTKASKDED